MPRELFTDGWNSLWHFLFGALGFYFWWVVVLFFAYELDFFSFQTPSIHNDTNLVTDISEFVIGFFTLWTLHYLLKPLDILNANHKGRRL